MDSLSFRNQQLAKRVELLQEELVVCETKGKKGKVIIKLRVSVTVKLSELKVSLNSLIFFLNVQNKGDTASHHCLETKNVFDEDLQKKIEENERLHIQVSCRVRYISVIML